MKSTISKSIQDLLSREVVLYVVKTALLSMVLSIVIIWLFWENLTNMISAFLSWVPWEWLQHTGAGIVNILLIYILFIIIVSLLTSLTSEKLLKKLASKHYPDIATSGTPDITTSLLLTLKATGLFLLLFIPSLPLIFVPIIGQVIVLYLWSILIKKPTIYDVSALFGAEEQIDTGKKATSLAMIASLFNYVPILNIFTPVFAQVLFLHYALSYSKSKNATNHQ
jgi:uncharacterized protein involved in cysteine biosynthesis